MDNRKEEQGQSQKTFILLGGYGNAGYFLSHFLLKETNVNLILAGRNKNKAEKLAEKLNQQFEKYRVQGLAVDAADENSLRNAFQFVDMVIVVASAARYVKSISRIALEMDIDYLDLIHSFREKIQSLKAISSEIKTKKRCFITDAGLYPGIPAVMVRYLASHFDSLIEADVGGVAKIDWLSKSSEMTLSHNALMEYFSEDGSSDVTVYKNGKWKKSIFHCAFMDFSKNGFGHHHFCMPWFIEEIRHLPILYPSLEQTGFYVSGIYLSGHNHFMIDWILLPITAMVLKIKSAFLLRLTNLLLDWGTKTLKPPYGAALVVNATGKQKGKQKSVQLNLSHEHVYKFTVIPVVACILQYLEGLISPGLNLQATCVEPNRFMRDISKMGVKINQSD